MTDTSTPYAVLLARDISHRLDLLADHLAKADPAEAAQIMNQVLDSEVGILGRTDNLLATASHYAKERAVPGAGPGLWQDLARTANSVHDHALDLEMQAGEFHALNARPSAPPPAPPTPAPPAGSKGRR
ncbi:hypothetical protein OIE62_07695 [Streptomyces scopuliridis]|uniref:Uncharacterized protein n=1 Tax=Streptomyces scopuliridis TaxID=452529 RepID=A0ACD4ZTQ6_9ACTN|nr:hypothetical protein [Streptomyces scopuliridis]WSC01551.1 hypothetical protein OG835_34125 [Streptomyces scopuliridis]WSC04911.1 hypothetical protein OIE62_07695 [Streptomyces scopuliridis]